MTDWLNYIASTANSLVETKKPQSPSFLLYWGKVVQRRAAPSCFLAVAPPPLHWCFSKISKSSGIQQQGQRWAEAVWLQPTSFPLSYLNHVMFSWTGAGAGATPPPLTPTPPLWLMDVRPANGSGSPTELLRTCRVFVSLLGWEVIYFSPFPLAATDRHTGTPKIVFFFFFPPAAVAAAPSLQSEDETTAGTRWTLPLFLPLSTATLMCKRCISGF